MSLPVYKHHGYNYDQHHDYSYIMRQTLRVPLKNHAPFYARLNQKFPELFDETRDERVRLIRDHATAREKGTSRCLTSRGSFRRSCLTREHDTRHKTAQHQRVRSGGRETNGMTQPRGGAARGRRDTTGTPGRGAQGTVVPRHKVPTA